VSAQEIPNEPDWLIDGINRRVNELTRPNMRGKVEVLAANLDLLVAVCADRPRPDWFVIDRYLCAAELMRIAAAVVFNKADTGIATDEVDDELNQYRHMDYRALVCSARTGANLDDVSAVLGNKTAIIVGQSGVGKSSLINALTDGDQRTAKVSEASGEGRHTTVSSAMISLPGGGSVVDSPGVRDYAPAIAGPAEVEYGFREIHARGEHCRFNNCRHRREPGCAVKDAVGDGEISERRYESYRRMLHLTERHDRARY
jgi:ribosome biogenesis GTPase